jgi:hypothetical protein
MVNRRPALSGVEWVDDVEFVFRATLQWIDVNFQIVLKQAAKVLKNAAWQLRVIFFVEQLVNARDAFARLRSFFEKN